MMAAAIVATFAASASCIPLMCAAPNRLLLFRASALPAQTACSPFRIVPSRSKPMNPIRFDWWTRSLARAGSRRAALRLVTSGAAGLAWLGLAEEAVACRKAGKKCKKSKQCCSKKCKGKKCRCTPLKGPCPGPASNDVCCPRTGATVGCSFLDNGFKPQCGPDGFQCLLAANSPCGDDCECGADLECGGSPTTRCCFRLGHSCSQSAESLCCSEQCGCTTPGSCTCRFANCLGPGQSCSLHTQCCDGICSSGECCLPLGIACASTTQCCGVLFCDAGFCATL